MNIALDSLKIHDDHLTYELVVLAGRISPGMLPCELPLGRMGEELPDQLDLDGLTPRGAAISYETQLKTFAVPDVGVPGVRLPAVPDWGGEADFAGRLPPLGLRSLRVTVRDSAVACPSQSTLRRGADALARLAPRLDVALALGGLDDVMVVPLYWGPAQRLNYLTYLDGCEATLRTQAALARSLSVGPLVAVATHHGQLTDAETTGCRSQDCLRVGFYDWADRLVTSSEFLARGIPLENLSERIARTFRSLSVDRVELYPRRAPLTVDGQAYVMHPTESETALRPH